MGKSEQKRPICLPDPCPWRAAPSRSVVRGAASIKAAQQCAPVAVEGMHARSIGPKLQFAILIIPAKNTPAQIEHGRPSHAPRCLAKLLYKASGSPADRTVEHKFSVRLSGAKLLQNRTHRGFWRNKGSVWKPTLRVFIRLAHIEQCQRLAHFNPQAQFSRGHFRDRQKLRHRTLHAGEAGSRISRVRQPTPQWLVRGAGASAQRANGGRRQNKTARFEQVPWHERPHPVIHCRLMFHPFRREGREGYAHGA